MDLNSLPPDCNRHPDSEGRPENTENDDVDGFVADAAQTRHPNEDFDTTVKRAINHDFERGRSPSRD